MRRAKLHIPTCFQAMVFSSERGVHSGLFETNIASFIIKCKSNPCINRVHGYPADKSDTHEDGCLRTVLLKPYSVSEKKVKMCKISQAFFPGAMICVYTVAPETFLPLVQEL
jgi:hypothetical protein